MSEMPDLDNFPPAPDEEAPPAESEEEKVENIPMGVDARNQPIKDAVGQQATGQIDFSIDPDLTEAGFEPSLGAGAATYTDLEENTNEFLTTDKTLLDDETESLTAEQADDADQTTEPTQPDTVTMDAEDISKIGTVTDMTAETGTIDSDNKIAYAEVTDTRTKEKMLEDGTLAEAKTQELAKEATVQYQLDTLMNAIDGSAEMPSWATKNIRAVNAIMNKRGVGNSSMASAAMVQALMESALPIAEADAQRFSTIQLKNLDNEQKTALQNAMVIASLDEKNLDNRMKAAKSNADAFLSMDLQNLKNEQSSAELSYQANTQALFKDAAAENAAAQLNTKLENDMNKFYDNLKVAVDTANANRSAAMEQFNVDQENSMIKFDAKLQDSRDKFNANMNLLIDQSNALWRRSINTANNAGENAVNQSNAAALLGITLAAQNQLWQQYRDEASMAFTSSENDEQRALQLTLTSIANQFTSEMFDKQMDFEDEKAMGSLFADVISGILDIGTSYLSADTGD